MNKIRTNINYGNGVKKIDKILNAITDWKIHIQSSDIQKQAWLELLGTLDDIKLQILWVLEISWDKKELLDLIDDYNKNKENKNELRKIWIKIIRLIFRLKTSFDKQNQSLKKVKLSDDVKNIVRWYYTNEENWNLIESLLIERILIDSLETKDINLILTPDLLDHKKIDFILRIMWDNDLKIWTQVTFTNWKHKKRKFTETENLAYEIDDETIDNPHEAPIYNSIKFKNLKPTYNPDLISFISISDKFWKEITWSDKQRLKKSFSAKLEKDYIKSLQDSLKDYEQELFRDLSVWYILASKEIKTYLETWELKNQISIPNSDYVININNNSSNIFAKLEFNWFVLAEFTFFITNKSISKFHSKHIKIIDRKLKNK